MLNKNMQHDFFLSITFAQMSTSKKIESLQELGEFGLIDRISKKIKSYQESTILGPSDDAGIVAHEKNTLVSSDLLIEGIHFDMTYTPLKHLGYKSVVVNLSDIYGNSVKSIVFNAFKTKIGDFLNNDYEKQFDIICTLQLNKWSGYANVEIIIEDVLD